MNRRIFLCICLTVITYSLAEADTKTKVIAHRGFWNTKNSAQNSLYAIREAGAIKCYGSEFDVQLTADGIPVVFHDGEVEGMVIEQVPYKSLENIKLANGEKIPTLDEYLKVAGKIGKTKLILEIKPHSTPEKETEAVDCVLEKVKNTGLAAKTEYISFSKHILQEIVRQQPGAMTAYLGSDLSPKQLKEMGFTGLDCNYYALIQNPSWTKEAHDLGLTVNVWTVDDEEMMRQMINADVDFITTNQPVLLQSLLEKKK